MILAITSMIGFTLGAAGLTIERGSPHMASENETYTTVTAADAVLIGSGVTFQATTYTLTADAVPGEDGVIKAVEIAAGGTFATDGANNNNNATGLIAVAGSNAKLKKPSNKWNSTFFPKGNFEIADPDGYGLTVNLPGSWSGGAFNATDAGVCFSGAGDVTLAAGWSNSGQGQMSYNKGLRFENTGKVTFQGEYFAEHVIKANDVFADSVTEVEVRILNTKYKSSAPTALIVNEGFTMRVKALSAFADNGGYCSGAGTIQMGAQDSDGTLKAAVRGDTLHFDKIGSGTLTVSSTANMPYVTVNAGAVLVKSSLAIRELFIDESASLIVDGCTVSVGSIDALSVGRIVTMNGGRVVVGVDSEKAVGWRADALTVPEGVTVVKSGTGRLTVYGATGASGSFCVEGGELAFSKLGLTDEYYRFTFKQVLGWIYRSQLQQPGHLNLVSIALYNCSGTRQLTTSGLITEAPDGTPAKDLAYGKVSVPEGQAHKPSQEKWTAHMGYLFANNTGSGTEFTNCNLDNAADETTWQVLTVRLPKGTAALDGYNFLSYWCAGVPCSWTIESSPNGVDWRTIADELDYYDPAVANNNNAGWLNGYAAKGDGTSSSQEGNLALHFDYIENGMAAGNPLSLKVGNNAVANFTAVTGGQPINEIIYETALGGGTIRNAAFAQTGALRITTATGTGRIDANTVLPLTFTDASDAANLENWSVIIDGKVVKRRRAKFVGDKIVIEGDGLILLLK